MGHVAIPSYRSGFYSPKRGGIPKYPQLWRGCVGAWCPSLGPTGLRLMDQSLYGNHGTLTNMGAASDWVVSGGRGALDMDGSDDRISIPNAMRKINGKLTFSIWFNNRGNFTSYATIMDAGGASSSERAMSMFLGANSGQFVGNFGESVGAFVNLSQSLSSNVWYHLVVTADSSSQNGKFWFNGALLADFTSSVLVSNTWGNNRTLLIGDSTTGGVRLNGLVDDFFLYDRLLTASEILLLARRRGIAYELDRTRNRYAAPATGTAVPVFMHHYLQQGVA